MSDFGTTISVIKENTGSFENSEIKKLSDKLKEFIYDEELENVLGEAYNNEFKRVDGENKPTLLVQLSEHFYSGEEDQDEETFEFVKDTELDDAELLISKLKTLFNHYSFEARVEEW